MSGFWSGWVIFLAVLTIGISVSLFVGGMRVKLPTQADGTTGHDWDGIREGVRNLPWWWIVYSAVGFLVALGYFVLYGGFGSSKGLLGWSSEEQLQRDVAANDAKLQAQIEPWRALTVEQLAGNAAAVSAGYRLYLDNCAACHGNTALGNQALGAPNLADADWQYGGSGEAIVASILDGRNGVMPPWDGVLGHTGVNEVAAYVLSLGGVKAPEDWIAAGKQRYETLCVSCHGPEGLGNPALGAPNVADRVWAYGGSFASVATSIRDGRSGVMPAWRSRLNDDQARLIAAWVVQQAPRERTAAN
jgi:cytochrome c oxidase cbb3-type subunit III